MSKPTKKNVNFPKQFPIKQIISNKNHLKQLEAHTNRTPKSRHYQPQGWGCLRLGVYPKFRYILILLCRDLGFSDIQ